MMEGSINRTSSATTTATATATAADATSASTALSANSTVSASNTPYPATQAYLRHLTKSNAAAQLGVGLQSLSSSYSSVGSGGGGGGLAYSSPQSAVSQPMTYPTQSLKYDIHAVSTFSPTFVPANIMHNKPTDQASRWSSSVNDQNQYLTVKLERPAVVQSIMFGKHHKPHVCNLKAFRVYAGIDPASMFEVLQGGLRNDTEPETFTLKCRSASGLMIPVQYIKVVPTSTFGKEFQYSIWYLELHGICDQKAIDHISQEFLQWREVEAIRLCLKHFRQRNYLTTFAHLSEATQLRLEDPLLTQLHQSLVMNGDFDAAEQILAEFAEQGMFSEYIENAPFRPVWRRIHAFDEHGQNPCMRGGHQLCIDTQGRRIYLFGGWDGMQDLADLWMYEIDRNMWTCLSPDTRSHGGPSPRSCHKMVFDDQSKIIYCLGRYVDQDSRQSEAMDSDFWQYDTTSRKWLKLSNCTQLEGGPTLLYDHQMCIDAERQIIYVFGGRVVTHDVTNQLYSGLYAYHIRQSKWELLRRDSNSQDDQSLRSRIGHSMLYNPHTNQLYIICGQRVKEYLTDFVTYDVASDTISTAMVSSTYSGPDAGSTQRCVYDPDLGELYLLSSLAREVKPITNPDVNSIVNGVAQAKNTLWVYKQKRDTWERIVSSPPAAADKSVNEPIPRFAHHLVYDQPRKCIFMFGGNPDNRDMPNQRLDDFWELSLVRASAHDVLRKCLFEIRRQKYVQMCGDDPIVALRYLQVQVGEVVDHQNADETAAFKALTSQLFTSMAGAALPIATSPSPKLAFAALPGSVSPASSSSTFSATPSSDVAYKMRTALYERLLEVFPTSMKQPKGNLIDLIPYA
ncbi:hypothetical protein RI367_004643 [Sorochytrium milnesiophthora]